MFVFQRVGVLYTEDVLYIFRSFEYLLAGLAFGLFDAGQRRGVDRDSGDGPDAACDPFRLVITSLPFFAGMQGNGDKEVYGTYRAVIRLELSRYLSSE